MIEVNLVEPKKAKVQTVVFGIDVTKINFKLLAASFVLLYVPDFTIYQYWDDETAAVKVQITELESKLQAATKDLEGHDNIRKELEAYNDQVDRLKKRSEQIDQILKFRTNPKKLLERVARNMPVDLWFETVDLLPSKDLRILGQSTSYKSIGNFIISANESPFFGKSFVLKESKTKEENTAGKLERVEEFVIEGRVEIFDPFEK